MSEKIYENDYSLLRAFNLEAAKRGEAICWFRDGEVLQDVTITPAGMVCGVWKSGVHQGVEETWSASIVPEKFRMAPLCWVEGKPVYKGDVLWWIPQEHWIVAKAFGTRSKPGIQADCDDPSEFAWLDKLTWTEPEQPLFMLDGKPVMKGQRLWYCINGKSGWHYADRIIDDLVHQDEGREDGSGIGWVGIKYLALDRPKPAPKGRKLWVNVYPSDYTDDAPDLNAYGSKDKADKAVWINRIACIEIELPPLDEVAK